MRRSAQRLLLLSVLLGAAPQASASLFDTYGFGARASAMGGAMAAQSSDYEAVYYNPANLLSRKAAHFGVGLSATSPHLAFERLSPSGCRLLL